MNDKIIISVIIPFYNRFDLLEKCISSIKKNKSKKFEIIIIDDGSDNKNSNKAIKLVDKNIHYFKISKNSERGFARNYGASKSRGKYLNFFDSDDLCYPNHIEDSIKYILENNPEIFCNSYEIKQPQNKTKKIILEGIINKQIYQGNLISCNSVFVKKNIFLRYKFCETRELSGSEDWDLWVRIALNHEFLANSFITSAIIDHEDRSTRIQKVDKVIQRLDILLKRIKNNEIFKANASIQKIIISEIYSFKSYTYSCDKNFNKTIIYLYKSIKIYFFKIILKRNFVIIRNLLI